MAPNRPIILTEPGVGVKKPAAVKCGEIMGGKTAECAVICCCCPCAVIDLVILMAVKLPAGLCRKAVSKRSGRLRRRTMPKDAKGGENKSCRKGDMGEQGNHGGAHCCSKEVEMPVAAEVKEKEEEMWARFYGAGFWRSPSHIRDHNQTYN